MLRGQEEDPDELAPLFEIKQTVDVEAERAAEEAALEAARKALEEPPPVVQVTEGEDGFLKKPRGYALS